MNPMVVLSTILAGASAQFINTPYAAGYYPGNVAVQAPLAYAQPAPVAYAQAPVAVAAAPAVAVPTNPSSQFHAQDEFANVNYGYSNINSQKHEVGNAYGGVAGAYSYVDANGVVQRTEYIADALGFRVKATNLPVAPEYNPADLPVAPVFDGVAPAPVEKTAEVKAAEAEFFKKFDEEASRTKRSAILPYNGLYAGAYAAGLPYAGAYAGLPYAGAYHGLPYATAYAAPAYAGIAPVVAKTPASTVKAVHAYTAPAVVAAPAVATYAAAPAIAAPVAAAPALTYAAAAPAVESTLTTIKLNPGHAVAYKVE